ncbi:FkbM family methyltransferase [Candidatus Poribacteria bacterium]|nr:FkbM family methyltransferase [Candidatus Poribacteria bacterium]
MGFTMRGPVGWGPVYTEYMTPALHMAGYEPLQTFMTLVATEEGGTFLDIGANQGYFSLLAAANARRELSVHAFEPVDYYHSMLAANVAANNLDAAITTHQVALGAKEAKQPLYIHGPASSLIAEWLPLRSGKQPSGGVADVRVARLDDMLDPDSVPHPIAIKLDVEGYERDVISGGARWFRHPQTTCILLEVSHREVRQRSGDVLAALRAWGFDCYGLAFVRRTDGPVREDPDLIPLDRAQELGRDQWPDEWLCVRRGHPYASGLLEAFALYPLFMATRMLAGDRLTAFADELVEGAPPGDR